MLRSIVLLASLTALCSPALAADWQIPLTCPDEPVINHWRPVTFGVPLLPGQAMDIDDLCLASRWPGDTGLTAMPAQFRVLARWWRPGMIPGTSAGDNSIRWVLVDANLVGDPGRQLSWWLIKGNRNSYNAPSKAKSMVAEQNDDAITIDTRWAGPAGGRFVINRKKFNLLDHAYLGDDKADMLASSPQTGGVIEDTYGNKYFASEGTKSVEVIESGPMRVQVRAKGAFIDPTGKGYSKGMYRYDVLMNFHAGQPTVYVDYVLTNNPAKSIGSPTFEDASVVLKLADKPTDCRLYGDKPVNCLFAKDSSFCLYQDSLGADCWAACPGVGSMHTNGWTYPKGTLTSFRGYRVYQRANGGQRTATGPDDCGEIVDKGDKARGLLQVSGARSALVVYPRNFWQLFPKAVEACDDGTVRLGLFPREFKAPHFFEDTSGSGTEFVLHFRGNQPADPNSKTRIEPPGAFDPVQLADAWDHRLMPRPPIEHMAACGALADMGAYSVPAGNLDKIPDSRVALYSSKAFSTDELYGNCFGWQVFGERWRSNGGHGSRGARQPINEDDYLYRWYMGGLPAWFDVGDARSRQFRDVRVYQIDTTEQDPFSFKDWAAFRAANRNEDWTNRPQPKDEEYLKFTWGRYARSDWPFPNPEHTTIDLLYDRYLLFGDVRCYENMRIGAAHGGYFSGRDGAMTDGWPWRANGWGMRALFRYWDLTGDKLAEACLKDVIKTHSAHIGKWPLICHNDVKKEQINWWFTNVYSHAASMIALHTGDPQMLELLKTLAVGKEKDAKQVPSLFAVLYHLTGEIKWKTMLMDSMNVDSLLRLGGYFTPCDHWLLTHPPRKH